MKIQRVKKVVDKVILRKKNKAGGLNSIKYQDPF